MEDSFSLRVPDNLLDSLYSLGLKFVKIILFIILAWIVLRIVLSILKKFLRLSRAKSNFEWIQHKIKLPFQIDLERVLTGFVRWSLILILVTIGADILEFPSVSYQMTRIIDFFPKLVSALALFLLGLYLASTVKKFLGSILDSFQLGGRRLLGNIAYFSIFILFSILAANQAGINTDIITTNLALILGAFLASVALAMGLGSRDIVFRLILGFYSRKNFVIGTMVKIDDFKGQITSIDNICMTVENDDRKIIYPIELVVSSKVEIIKK
jgi:hypothetical protein